MGREGWSAKVSGRLPLVLSVLAFGLYVTGYNVARRDIYLDGALLYEARLVQMAAFLLFKNILK